MSKPEINFVAKVSKNGRQLILYIPKNKEGQFEHGKYYSWKAEAVL